MNGQLRTTLPNGFGAGLMPMLGFVTGESLLAAVFSGGDVAVRVL
jgi:hypothetical protein